MFSYDPYGDYWEDDVIIIYIGLYNQSLIHQGFERGEEPDYKFILRPDGFVIEQVGPELFYSPDNTHYAHPVNGTNFSPELKISLDSIARLGNAYGDKLFQPQKGMKIPLDIEFHDSDATNSRDGVLAYSSKNDDNSWRGVQNWYHTWTSDTSYVVTGIRDSRTILPLKNKLMQNYPNLFNPKTTIGYSLLQSEKVLLKIYDVRGKEVATLINRQHSRRAYTYIYRMPSLQWSVFLRDHYNFRIFANQKIYVT